MKMVPNFKTITLLNSLKQHKHLLLELIFMEFKELRNIMYLFDNTATNRECLQTEKKT